MDTKPDAAINNVEEKLDAALLSRQTQVKPQIYPEINERVMKMLKWFGLAFVAMVILVQFYSGYS